MVRDVLLTVVFSLVYVFLLTILFENFINRSSSTLLSLLALVLFTGLTFFYVTFIIKKIKNRFK